METSIATKKVLQLKERLKTLQPYHMEFWWVQEYIYFLNNMYYPALPEHTLQDILNEYRKQEKKERED